MTSINKEVLSTDAQTFEQTYKTAYSHGLEAIYTLENVDIKSIRPIGESQIVSVQSKNLPEPLPISIPVDCQPEFDLGSEFCVGIDAFVIKEPIQVLNLSRHAEKCLIESGRKVLGDIIGFNLRELVFLKGMGQGHIDEIQQKLLHYIQGKPLKQCRMIDFASWIRSLVADQDRKKIYVLMQTFELSELFSLTPAESVEVRRLTLEKRQEWIEEMLLLFQTQPKQQSVISDMRKVVDVFFKPWIRQRLGFATNMDLVERLERMSCHPQITLRALSFFSEVYYHFGFPLKDYLHQIDDNLYCADIHVVNDYNRIVDCAITYFYKPDVCYLLDELISLVEREFSRKWEGFPEGFIERVFRLSSLFNVRKGVHGHLEVSLA